MSNGMSANLDVGEIAERVVPLQESGEVSLGGAFGKEVVQSDNVPGDEGDVGDGDVVANEEGLLREDTLEDFADSLDLSRVSKTIMLELVFGRRGRSAMLTGSFRRTGRPWRFGTR